MPRHISGSLVAHHLLVGAGAITGGEIPRAEKGRDIRIPIYRHRIITLIETPDIGRVIAVEIADSEALPADAPAVEPARRRREAGPPGEGDGGIARREIVAEEIDLLIGVEIGDSELQVAAGSRAEVRQHQRAEAAPVGAIRR